MVDHGGRSGRMSSSTLMVEAVMWTLSGRWNGECLLVELCLGLDVD